MTEIIRPLIAGNWKMNGLKSSLAEFEAMLAGAADVAAKADLLVCPPATLIADFAQRARSNRTLGVGAQDCHAKPSGAHTGDLSAEMLADAGARAIIVGHSERRADHGETDIAGPAEGGSRLARWPDGDRLHRGDPGPARSGQNPGYLPRSAHDLAAGWRARGQSGGGL